MMYMQVIPTWYVRFTFRGEELWFRVTQPHLKSFIEVILDNRCPKFSCEEQDLRGQASATTTTPWQEWNEYMNKKGSEGE